MKKKEIIPILIFLLILGIANAISFYSGNVVITSFKADVNIQENANVVLNYTLTGNEKVNLNFNNVPESAEIKINNQNYPKNFDLEINGDISIIVQYSTGIGAGTPKQFSLNPNILFNDMVNSNRINNYLIKIKMPIAVNEFLSSSEKPTYVEVEGGRKTFFWEKINAYASALSITWHELNINIDVERIVPSIITDEFTVRNIIRNNGGDISNVKLVQSFLESSFDPVAPVEEFERIQAGNDRRLEWKKEVSSIPGGTAIEFSYKLKLLNRGENVVFRPLYVYVDNVLVKVIERAEYTTAGIEPLTLNSSYQQISEPQGVISPEQIAETKAPTPPSPTATPIPPQKDIAPSVEQKEGGKAPALEKAYEPKIIKKKNTLLAIAIIIGLLILMLLLLFLNRRKEEGVRF